MTGSSLTREAGAAGGREYLETDGARWNIWDNPGQHFQKASDLLRCRILRAQVPRGAGLVVDVGCGDGYLSAALASRNRTVVSLDLSRTRLRKAEPACGAAFRPLQADCCRLPLQADVAGAVVLSEVLEHLEDPARALAEAARVLAPGGRLIVSVPHAQDAPATVCPHCRHQFNSAGHLWHFAAADLVRLAAAAGLSAERVFTAGSPVTRYLLRHWPRLAPASLMLDALFCRVAPSEGLYLIICCTRRGR
jgi:SAM-dependent methyltransferase